MNAQSTASRAAGPTPPYWFLAELTYTCPLHCPFCYNPVDFATVKDELSTEEWKRVLREARALGSVQCGFSGGEPLQRKDLEELVAEAHTLGFYTNLLTSGIGLTEKRIAKLKEVGLDHIQLSFQDSTREVNDFLSSARTFELKRKAAALIRKYDFDMVMNCVIHRMNIDHIGDIIALADEIGASYLELANAQYYSWASININQLLPTREQLQQAERTTNEWRKKLGQRMKLLFVVPDYYETRPKKCMNGWGSTFLGIAPDGLALPCQTARDLPGLDLPNVRDMSVHDIWYESPGFSRFRGTDWMQEPCTSCDIRDACLGGCRCQAFALTGDATRADPVCDKSPDHDKVLALVEAANRPRTQISGVPLVFRGHDESLALAREREQQGSAPL